MDTTEQHVPEQHVPEQDVRKLVQIVGEALHGSGEVSVKKRRLMESLAGVIGADAWVWVVSRYKDADDPPMAISFLQNGFSDEGIAMIMRSTQDPKDPPPENEPLMREVVEGAHITRSRRDLVPDGEWYKTGHFEKYRKPLGVDEFVYSIFPLGDGIFSAVGFHRAHGRDAFTDRERRLAHIVISEIRWLHRDGVPNDDGVRVPDLSPRLRTVYGLLLEGWSRKKIAQQLELSINTIAEYSKDVYKHFGVSGQRELLGRFMAGDGGDRPGQG